MKKIIPFKKQLSFKTNVFEITSISLENELKNINGIIDGYLIISGTYKITENSIKTDEFEFKIPINIEIDDKYEKENIMIDINDFFYEIINNSILEVNIELMLDNIVEKKLPIPTKEIKEEEKLITMEREENIVEDRCIDEEIEEVEHNHVNILDEIETDNEDYSIYHIYIVREGDTLETIMNKYNITKEALAEYNDLTELRLGEKIIIPEI